MPKAKKVSKEHHRIDYIQHRARPMSPQEMRAKYEAQQVEDDIKDERHRILEGKICRNMFKVLIVDDEADILEMNRIFVQERCQFNNVLIAEDGDVALEILKKHHDINIVLSDYRMPNMNGYKLYVEAMQLVPPPLFFIITGFDDYEVRALKQQKVMVFPKPFKFEDLQKVLEGFYIKMLDNIVKEQSL